MRLVLAALLVLAVSASSAHAANYRATFSGTQELRWKLDGTNGSCEIRRGTGQGTVKLTIKGNRSATLFSSGSKRINLLGSIPSTARGTISGSFTERTETPCPGFEPDGPRTAATDGCGAVKFGVRLDLKPVGAFTYLFGPGTPGPRTGECPFYIDNSFTSTNDLTACGDSLTVQHKRNWAVSSSGGQGLFAGRLSATQTKPLKKGRSKTLTVRIPVSCTVDGTFTGGVTITGVAKYQLKLKRVG